MTTSHHPEPKPKMGKVRNPSHPLVDPKPNPDHPRPDPEMNPRTGKNTQSTQSGQGARSTQNPQTAKPGLYPPPPADALPKKGTDVARRDAKQDEEDKTWPGMHHSKAGPNLPGNVKK